MMRNKGSKSERKKERILAQRTGGGVVLVHTQHVLGNGAVMSAVNTVSGTVAVAC